MCQFNVHKIYMIDIYIYIFYLHIHIYTYKSLHLLESDVKEPVHADDADDNTGEESTTKCPNHSTKVMTISLGARFSFFRY